MDRLERIVDYLQEHDIISATAESCTAGLVASELAEGALNRNNASMAIANTGVAGPAPGDDGTPIGKVCFAWAVRSGSKMYKFSETRNFDGDRNQVRQHAAHYVLERIPHYHRKAHEETD